MYQTINIVWLVVISNIYIYIYWQMQYIFDIFKTYSNINVATHGYFVT